MLANIIIWTMTFLISFGVGATIMNIGKPRKPCTPGVALTTLVIASLELGGLLYLQGQL